MRTSVALAALALFLPLSASAEEPDPLPDSTRISIVFPFEVGQEYEFKSAFTFHRPNGDTLPPETVATITIADTVINGQTWLHIPYWTPFGTEYYRLDDSLRVWNLDVARGDSLVLVDMNPTGWSTDLEGVVPCDSGHMGMCFDVRDPSNSRPPHWAYPSASSENTFKGITVQLPELAVRDAQLVSGWTNVAGDTVLGLGVRPTLGVSHSYVGFAGYHGLSGAGQCGHVQGETHLWGLFRVNSDEPWPVLSRQATVVGIDEHPTVPSSLHLSAFPNPFNPSVTISYSLPEAGPVRMEIRTVTGQLVRMLIDGHCPAEGGSATWDGTNNLGHEVASGTYVCRLLAGGVVVTQRVTLVR